MASPEARRTGRVIYNGLELNLYGLLPDHLINKDQDAASPAIMDTWDPGNSRIEKLGAKGKVHYLFITDDSPKPLTVAVFAGGQGLVDDGEGNILDAADNIVGALNYDTGRLDVTFPSITQYDPYISYSTGPVVPYASHWDEEGAIWDRLAPAPVIQRTFWAIEIDAVDILQVIDNYDDVSYVDRIPEDYTDYGFRGWAFDGQIVDIDIDKSRQWLREMPEMWKLKCAFRMWFRLMQNLGFSPEIYPLYKRHPLNNYGENPGELYSRTLTEITLEQQEAYERALVAAGNDPSLVSVPVTGSLVQDTVGTGADSFTLQIQFPAVDHPPDWSTVQLAMYTTSGGLLAWSVTLDPDTGEIEVDDGSGVIGEGSVDLVSGTGLIVFSATLITTEYYLDVEYREQVSPYQAARVDIEVDVADTPGFNAGDRAADAIVRALEYVRPIHVIVRLLVLRLEGDEQLKVSEAGCCGPNVVRALETDYAEVAHGESNTDPVGGTIYSDSMLNTPVVPGSVVISEPVSGQEATDSPDGNLVDSATGNVIGFIAHNAGVWWIQFASPTASPVTFTYRAYDILSGGEVKDKLILADAFDQGEAKSDRSHEYFSTTYENEDRDAAYKMLTSDLVTSASPVAAHAVTAGERHQAGFGLNTPIIPATLTISDPGTGQSVSDDGTGFLSGDGFGEVSLADGTWYVRFNAVPTGVNLTISYTYPTAGRYAGTLASNLVPGSVYIRDYVTGQLITDDGAGNLVGDVAAGVNTVDYATGAYDVTYASVPTEPLAVYSFVSVGAHPADSEDVRFVLEDRFQRPHGYIKIVDTGTVSSKRVSCSRSMVSDFIAPGQYAGILSGDTVPGTVSMVDSVSGQTITDDGSGNLVQNSVAVGTITYATGVYSVTFASVPSGGPIVSFHADRVGEAGVSQYEGTVVDTGAVVGSLEFRENGGAQALQDSSPVTTLSGSGGSGSLDYSSGVLSVVFNSATASDPVAEYQYIDASGFLKSATITLGSAGASSYSGTLTGGQVVPGSVTVKDESGSQEVSDDGSVPLSGNGTGTYDYLTGAYSLTFAGATATYVRLACEDRTETAY